MSNPSAFNLAQKVSDSVESENALSLEKIKAAFALRWGIVAFCAILTPLIAVGLASLVPLVYKGTAQLLVSAESGGSLLMNEEANGGTSGMSGPSAAEMLKSVPVVARMAETQGVTAADVARPAYKVLFGYVAKAILPLLPPEKDDGTAATISPWETLAGDIKPSIKATSLQLEARSFRPTDQIVEVTLSSTSKTKVAAMTNGLLESFIASQGRRLEADALRAYETLVLKETATRESLTRLRKAATDNSTTNAELDETERLPQIRSVSDALTRSISELELRVIDLSRTYASDAPELARARAELTQARRTLDRQESIDTVLSQIADLKRRERQALLNAELARNGQTGLIILEKAMPPRGTALLALLRFGLPAGVGLFLGVVIGVALLVILTVLDPQVRTRWDVESALGVLPLLEVKPADVTAGSNKTGTVTSLDLSKVLGQVESGSNGSARFLTVTTPDDEASDSVAETLATTVARDPRKRVLLVETKSRHEANGAPSSGGFAALLQGKPLAELTQQGSVANLRRLEAGEIASFQSLCKSDWRQAWDKLAQSADLVVIQCDAIAQHGPAEIFMTWSDFSVLVVQLGASKISALKQAAPTLSSLGKRFLGVVLVQGPIKRIRAQAKSASNPGK